MSGSTAVGSKTQDISRQIHEDNKSLAYDMQHILSSDSQDHAPTSSAGVVRSYRTLSSPTPESKLANAANQTLYSHISCRVSTTASLSTTCVSIFTSLLLVHLSADHFEGWSTCTMVSLAKSCPQLGHSSFPSVKSSTMRSL